MAETLLNKVNLEKELNALRELEEAVDRLRDGHCYDRYPDCAGFVHMELGLWEELLKKHNAVLTLRGESPNITWKEHIQRRGH